MNIDQQQIKTEISFAGIETVLVDSTNPEVMFLKLKVCGLLIVLLINQTETTFRKVICKYAKHLAQALTESIRQYQACNDNMLLQIELAGESNM